LYKTKFGQYIVCDIDITIWGFLGFSVCSWVRCVTSWRYVTVRSMSWNVSTKSPATPRPEMTKSYNNYGLSWLVMRACQRVLRVTRVWLLATVVWFSSRIETYTTALHSWSLSWGS